MQMPRLTRQLINVTDCGLWFKYRGWSTSELLNIEGGACGGEGSVFGGVGVERLAE